MKDVTVELEKQPESSTKGDVALCIEWKNSLSKVVYSKIHTFYIREKHRELKKVVIRIHVDGNVRSEKEDENKKSFVRFANLF